MRSNYKISGGQQLRILLELTYAHRGIGGAWIYIQRYLEALVQMFQEIDTVTPVFFIRANYESFELLPDDLRSGDSLLVNVLEFSLERERTRSTLHRIYQEHVVTPRKIAEWDIDVVHWFGNHASFINGKNQSPSHFITVHDLLPFEADKETSNRIDLNNISPVLKRFFHQTLYNRDARRKNRIFVPISESTRTQIKRFVPEATIHKSSIPVSTSVPEEFGKSVFGNRANRVQRQAFLNKYNLSSESADIDNYHLYVAHFYPHKNHLSLIEAYEQYRKEGGVRSLVLRGDPIEPDCYRTVAARVEASNYQDYIHLLPRLKGAEMNLLYDCSIGQIFPSRHEGGGIPVMESLFHARPVACSRLTVFEEYYGSIPHYLENFDGASIKEGLHWLDWEWDRLRNDPAAADEFMQKVKEVRGKFSPEAMQQKILHLYDEWVW